MSIKDRKCRWRRFGVDPKRIAYWATVMLCGALQDSAQQHPWQHPKPGWFYILDQDDQTKTSSVLVVNDSGAVVQKLGFGYRAAFAQSHDGNRLYVVSGVSGLGSLAIVDTSTGATVASISVPNRVIFTLLPDSSTIAVSADDSQVFVEEMRTVSPGVDEYYLSIIDSRTRLAKDKSAALPGCGMADLTEGPTGWDIAAHCAFTNSIRLLAVDPSTGSITAKDVVLPTYPPRDATGAPVQKPVRRASVACMNPSGETYAIMPDGKSPANAENVLQLDEKLLSSVPRFVPFQRTVRAGQFLYLGSTSSTNVSNYQGRLDEIEVFNLTQRRHVAAIPVPSPYFSLSSNRDGSTILAVSSIGRQLELVNVSGRSTQVISGIGSQPVAVLAVH